MKGGVILFVVEGPSDQDAIVAFIAEELKKQNIKTTVKIMHGDILTKYEEYTRDFEVSTKNVKKKVKDLITEYLASSQIKSDRIKVTDINKIYYITDTDNCFFSDKSHSINKKECLNKMFNFEGIELTKTKKSDFEIIFFSYNLEHVIVNKIGDISNREKENIASDFAIKSLLDRDYFIDTFFDNNLKKWSTYRESYKGINIHQGRACNMNNLLDDIETWKAK